MPIKCFFKNMITKVKTHYASQCQLVCKIISGQYLTSGQAPTWMMRFVMSIIVLARCASLGQILQGCSREEKQNDVIDLYVAVAFVTLVGLLFWIPKSWVAFVTAIYLMIELFMVTLGVILVDRHQPKHQIRSPERSIVLLALGYLELIIGSAILYLSYSCIEFSSNNELVSSSWDALYFSTATITTLGFGDIRPISQSGRILVIFETLAGIWLIVYALSIFILSSRTFKVEEENQNEQK